MPELLLTCCLSGHNTRNLLRKKPRPAVLIEQDGSVILLCLSSLQLRHRRPLPEAILSRTALWAHNGGKKKVCPEEGHSCVCSLNYRVWQHVCCASVFKMLATDWRWRSEICVCSGGTIRHRWNVLRVVLPEDFLLLFWADSISELFHVTDYQMRPMNASQQCFTS